MEQEITGAVTDSLPYGVGIDYLNYIRPNGYVRSWVSVEGSPDPNVKHDFKFGANITSTSGEKS